MGDKEREDYLKSLREYATQLQKDSVARRKLLSDAGIVEKSSGKLTSEYRKKSKTPVHN
ncbi:MAG: hypothetical protein WCG80_19480 [Spirochaetales bacterium]